MYKKIEVELKGKKERYLISEKELKSGIDLRNSGDIMFRATSINNLLEEYLREVKISRQYTFKEHLENKRISYIEMPNMILTKSEIECLGVGNRYYYDSKKREIYLIQLIENKKKDCEKKFIEYLNDEYENVRKEVINKNKIKARLIAFKENEDYIKKLYRTGDKYKITITSKKMYEGEIVQERNKSIKELEEDFNIKLKEINFIDNIKENIITSCITKKRKENEVILER